MICGETECDTVKGKKWDVGSEEQLCPVDKKGLPMDFKTRSGL
jgi:hypothetical protein